MQIDLSHLKKINKKGLFIRAICCLSKKNIMDKEVIQRQTATSYLSKVFSTLLFTDSVTS